MKELLSQHKRKVSKLIMGTIGTCILIAPIIANANPIPPTPSDPFAGVIAAIKAVGKEMQALAIASAKTANKMMYQIDNNLAAAAAANSQTKNIQMQAQNTTTSLTQQQITDSLLQFPMQVVDANQLNDPTLTKLINDNKQIIPDLTLKTPASDTLYLSKSDAAAATYGVAKPSENYDDYFNFNSVITPTAYDNKQRQAAQAYLQYTAQQYQSLAENIDFAKLKSELNNLSPNARAQKLQNFVNNPTYQKYQLAIRSLIAAKSAALSNLNYLIAERTAVKGLATQSGIPNDPNLPTGYASPLQVENYIANQRLNNSRWAKTMQTASPTTINREQLMILAEIESELQRNHLDSERLLATLSVMSLQSSQLSQATLQRQIQQVNAVIDPSQKQNTNQ